MNRFERAEIKCKSLLVHSSFNSLWSLLDALPKRAPQVRRDVVQALGKKLRGGKVAKEVRL
jgi:hypothetical protein